MDNAFIRYLQLYRAFSTDEATIISSHFESASFKEGEYLFKAGHISKRLFFICNGVVRIVMQQDNGNEVTQFFLKENQFCTILNSFNNQVLADENIQAACDTEVMFITKDKLTALYNKLPYLKELINQIMQQALIDKIQLRNAYLGQDSTTRYQLFIIRQPDIALRVPLSYIASYLGITPQSLSRIRKNIR